MRDFFNRESQLNDIVIYRVSSTKARIAIGKVIANNKKWIQLNSIAIEDGMYKKRQLSRLTKGVFIIVKDQELESLFEAVTCQE